MSSTLWRYFHDVQVDCPYGRPLTAVYRQAHFGNIPATAMVQFLAAGFRRNGNYLYTMVCPDCQACIPIRLQPELFWANRNQKRVLSKNNDIIVKFAPIQISGQKLVLCEKFLQRRFPGKGNSALDYYAGFFLNSMGDTFELEFWCEEKLIGVSIVDIYPEAMNCVYFYFDPDESHRSPGTYNILTLIEYALSRQIDFVYLGYWIEEVAAMRYKKNFRPHYLLQNGEWIEIK